MKNLFISTLLAVFLFSISSAYADNTSNHVVERIQITDSGVAYFRPVGLGAWGGTGCPDAVYTYISTSAPAFDNIVSLAITSKLNGTPVRFNGTCNEAGSYMLITYAYLM